MIYQLPEVRHDGDEQDLLRYERYEPNSGRPYMFTTLLGYHPGTEVCLGLKSIEDVRDKLKPGLRFVLCRTKDDEYGYMLGLRRDACDERATSLERLIRSRF